MKINSECLSLNQDIPTQLAALIQASFSSKLHLDTPGQMIRLSFKLPPIDILSWFEAQTYAQKVYWSERFGRFEVAGLGQVEKSLKQFPQDFQSLDFTALPKDLRFYGGIAFDAKQELDEDWSLFTGCQFWIPQFELSREEQEFCFSIHFQLAAVEEQDKQYQSIIQAINQLKFEQFKSFVQQPSTFTRQDNPPKEEWLEQVRTALKLIDEQYLEKIILARKTTLSFKQKVDISSLMSVLKAANPDSFHYCFQLAEGRAFIGASPERLYRRFNDQIFSEAIAGTRKRDKHPEIDSQLGEDLLHSDKDLREHRFVSKFIQQALKPLCHELEIDQAITLLKRSHVQHLYRGLRGSLKAGIQDKELIDYLHPTPAVGGYPQEIAAHLIQDIETFERGWYTGAVGWFNQHSSEFAVGIRCGLVEHNQLNLYSGAGIIAGSEPLSEWEEIESKIANFIQLFSHE